MLIHIEIAPAFITALVGVLIALRGAVIAWRKVQERRVNAPAPKKAIPGPTAKPARPGK